MNSYEPSDESSRKDFQQVANGVFQSEGCISARIRGKGLAVSPVAVLGQNYSAEAVEFFVRFYNDIGRIGNLGIVKTLSGKLYIRWTTESWEAILGGVTDYFSSLYGEKYIGLQKLLTIHELKARPSTDEQSKVEIVKLVYSLAASGRERRTLLGDKLDELNLPFLDEDYEPETRYLDNPSIPSFFFILGFLLGDGTIFIRIRQTSAGALNFIPVLDLFQKTSESNIHFFTMMSAFFTNLGCKSFMVDAKSGMTSLKVEGVKSILVLIPLFQKNMALSYWKFDSLDLLLKFFKYRAAGLHTHRKGINLLLNLLYKYPNGRTKTLDEWVNISTEYFDDLEANNISGHQFIYTQKGRGEQANEIISWRVDLPVKSEDKSLLSSKYFQFSTFGSRESALQAALAYRDSSLDSYLKDF